MAANDYDDDDDESPFDRNGLLKDGRTTRVSMMMRDGMSDVQRAIAQDAVARRFGLRHAFELHQPGPRYCTDAAGLERKARAYAEMVRDAENAWCTPAAEAAPQPPVEVKDARPPIPVTDADFARLRRIKQAAYDRAKAEAQDAWKTPSAPAADVAPPVRRAAVPDAPTYDVAEGRRRKQAAYDAMCREDADAWRNPLP